MQEHTPEFVQPQFDFDKIPYGYCQCGCGGKTTLATRTRKEAGWIKGQPLRYLLHHYGLETVPKEDPNPSGLCHCGCGQPTPIAKESNAKLGHIAGKPVRFILGHALKIRTIRPVSERFWEKVGMLGPDECWLWQASCDPHGYGQFHYKGKCWPAHRVAYELHYGPIPDGLGVLHKCDRPACCNPAHFFLGTQADNSFDMWAKGRGSNPPRNYQKDEKANKALFTNAQVREFRRQHEELGVSTAELARSNGVEWDTMWQIIKRIVYQDA